MRKKALLLISLVSFLILNSSSFINNQSLTYEYDDYIDLPKNEIYTHGFYPNDLVYEISLSLEDYSSFNGIHLAIRGRINSSNVEGCRFLLSFYNFDNPGSWVDESIQVFSHSGWTDWIEADININIDTVYVDVAFAGDSHCFEYTELEIIAQEDIPASEDEYDPPTIDFWAEDYYISEGDCVTIFWQATNADSAWFQNQAVPHESATSVCPTQTTTYEFEIRDYNGNYHSSTLTIEVDEPYVPPPDYAFWADEYQIFEGECVHIYWQTRDAEYVWVQGDQVAHDGNQRVCLYETTEFFMDVQGLDGSIYEEYFVIYVDEKRDDPTPIPEQPKPADPQPQPARPQDEPPIIDFWADEYVINPATCTTLRWSVSNAEKVYVDGYSQPTKGSDKVCPPKTTTYELNAVNKDGLGIIESITIRVERIEVTCEGDDRFLLIVTDSELLNASTGDSSTWNDVKSRLKSYYEGTQNDCSGKPYFLDIAQVKNTKYPSVDFIDRQIEKFIREMNVSSPAAVAIIGGTNVIPTHTIYQDYLPSDDIYADFDHDNNNSPDTVITRLPDGSFKEVLINYISALSQPKSFKSGALYVSDLINSAHRLAQYNDLYLESPLSSGGNNKEVFLEDYIQLQTDREVLNILTPPNARDQYYAMEEYAKYFRSDDQYNSNVSNPSGIPSAGTWVNGVEKYLDYRHIVFGNFSNTDRNDYYLSMTPVGFLSNIFDDPTFESPFSHYEAQELPKGAHIFSIADNSALIDPFKNNANSIPINALYAGVHHFIGRNENFFDYQVEKFTLDGKVFTDLNLDKGIGPFTKYFFEMSSNDPATNFWRAKVRIYENFKIGKFAARTFAYLGLPERNKNGFGKDIQVSLQAPSPSDIKDSAPSKSSCPSGDPNDCDGDGLNDSKEYYLASFYAPYIIPDEDEDSIQFQRNHGSPEPFGVFWQVSPEKFNGREGAWITYVFSYTNDFGVHYVDMTMDDCMSCMRVMNIDICDCNPFSAILNPFDVKNKACCALEAAALPLNELSITAAGTCNAAFLTNKTIQLLGINFNPNQAFFGHPGDNEAFRIFVADDGSYDWQITHVNWKRHHEGFDYEGMLQTVSQAEANGLSFYKNSDHPILYASGNKHAMYPTKKACEDYRMEFVDKCIITFEDCGDHPIYNESNPIKTLIRKEFNVGEREGTVRNYAGILQQRFNLMEKLAPVFPDENVWETCLDRFCGNIPPGGGLADEDCGGPMGKLWYPAEKSICVEF